MRFEEFFHLRTNALFDRQKTQAILKDLLQNDKKTVDLLMKAYDIGIVSNIRHGNVKIPSVRDALIFLLRSEHNVSAENARRSIELWERMLCPEIIYELYREGGGRLIIPERPVLPLMIPPERVKYRIKTQGGSHDITLCKSRSGIYVEESGNN